MSTLDTIGNGWNGWTLYDHNEDASLTESKTETLEGAQSSPDYTWKLSFISQGSFTIWIKCGFNKAGELVFIIGHPNWDGQRLKVHGPTVGKLFNGRKYSGSDAQLASHGFRG